MQQPHFVALANRKSEDSIFAPKLTVPKSAELVALLKFWKSTLILKNSVDPVIWPAFVINAFRRFIIFASALQFHLDSHPMLHVLPPIDVLWVWHSLLQSPAACYASFAHAKFVKFMYLPFPLEQVGKCIDNSLFLYTPDNLGFHNFNAIVNDFGFDVTYDVLPLDPNCVFYPIFCPVSGTQLGTVLLAHYASPQMRLLTGTGVITHGNLARLQTEADLRKVKAQVVLPRFSGHNVQSSLQLGAYFATTSGFFNNLPLVHLTVGSQCIKLSGDWITHALHDSVPELVENLGWLFQNDLESKLEKAVGRYRRFWQVVSKSSPELAVPTLDIRVVWSAHLSNFSKYADYSITKARSVVVPAQAGAQSTSGLYTTAKQFHELFGCSYCQCKCRFCNRYNWGGKNKSGRYMAVAPGASFSCAKNIYDFLLPAIDEEDPDDNRDMGNPMGNEMGNQMGNVVSNVMSNEMGNQGMEFGMDYGTGPGTVELDSTGLAAGYL